LPQLKNDKHEQFAQAYAAGASATAAYVRAGFKDNRNARVAACRLRKVPLVHARIIELQEQLLPLEKRMEFDVQYYQDKLAIVLEIDPLDLFEEDPADPLKCRMRPLRDIPPHVRQALKIEVDPSTAKIARIGVPGLTEKLPAMATLLKTTPGGSIDRHEVTGLGGGPIQHQVLLDVLLSPANLQRLDDAEIETIRSAALKLAGPAPGGSGVVDADYTDITPAQGAGGR